MRGPVPPRKVPLLTRRVSSAAATCYTEIILKESDNNVKLIALDRINDLRDKHDKILDDAVMDILRVLSRYARVRC